MNNDTHEIPVHMFLFEKSFIVCYYKKNAREFELADEYRYWTMFQIKKMKIESGENREFIVTDTETEQSVTLVANTVKEKDEWVKRIKKEVRNIDKLVKKLMMQAVSIDPESPPLNKHDS
jgi:mevalonate kinase